MKYIFTILITFSIFSLSAQDKSPFHKLDDLYAQGRFEDCAYKAENMTYNEKFRKLPEPYLYMSMCYHQISMMDAAEVDGEYKDPLKEAMKYAAKYTGKDDDGSSRAKHADFMNEIKLAGIERGFSYLEEKNYSKATYTFKQIVKFDPNDDNVRFAVGVCDFLNKNVGEGNVYVKESLSNLSTKYAQSGYEADKVSEPVLVRGFIEYSDYLKEHDNLDSAKATILLAERYVPGNGDISSKKAELID